MKKKTCLHCGNNKASYCEECYQKLLTINISLQCKLPKEVFVGIDIGSGVSKQIEINNTHIPSIY